MLRIYIILFAMLLVSPLTLAQGSFTGTWSFEGNDNGNSSNQYVGVSAVSYTGVNKLAVNPYTSGFRNLGVNIQNWSTTLCNNTEYVEFTVQPLGTATVTLTTLSFAFSRSPAGPQQLTVRSSADGFSSNIFSQGVSESYQVAAISLNGPGFTDRTNALTFRIYACNPTAGGGTLKLDEIQLSGFPLPVTLISFTAKPDGDRVQLDWTTTWERDADRFIVERSADLTEFTLVGEATAKGTSDQRQDYGLTDPNPRPGVNYYRLKQRDFDGTTTLFKPVSVIIRADQPAISVFPNPAEATQIHLRLWNADNVTVRLLNVLGQSIAGQLDRTPGEATFSPVQPLLAGLYFLEVSVAGQRRMVRTLVK